MAALVLALSACGRSPLRVEPDLTRDGGAARFDAAGFDAARFDAAGFDAGPSETPRLIAPLSTSTVTSRRPTLRWLLAGGRPATVELCRDRACATVIATLEGVGSARPESRLPRGWVFWRVMSDARVSATWQLWVGRRNAPNDTSWGTAFDVNGDGYTDAVVDIVMGATVSVGVHHGTADGLESEPTTVIAPGPCNSRAGARAVGDLNGDGYADILLNESSDWCRPGNARIFLGGPAGVSAAPQRTLLGRVEGSPGFGAAAIAAGDVDGDGYGDLVVGTQRRSVAGPFVAELWRGGPAGIDSARGQRIEIVEPLSLRAETPPIGAGDLDGDGIGDLVVGPSVFLGRTSGPLAPSFTFDRFVKGVVVADVNGDGRADWIVASDVVDPRIEPARVSVFHGAAGGIGGAPATVFMGTDQYYARSLRTEDFNDDGFADVEVRAPSMTRRYFGGPDGLSGTE